MCATLVFQTVGAAAAIAAASMIAAAAAAATSHKTAFLRNGYSKNSMSEFERQ